MMTYQQLCGIVMSGDFLDEEDAEIQFNNHYKDNKRVSLDEAKGKWTRITNVLKGVAIGYVVRSLNEMVQMDPIAMHALMETRVSCQDMLAHPTVVCVCTEDGRDWTLGFLEVLNGLLGIMNSGCIITAVFDDQNQLRSFCPVDDPSIES